MRPEPSNPEPSRCAISLITFFGPGESGQAALGDLLEDFAHRRTTMGGRALQRWFWCETVRTLAYLVVRELRSAPLVIAGAAVSGFIFRWYVSRSMNPTVTVVIDALLHRFGLYTRDPYAYVFWTIHLMYADRLLVNLLVGVILGLAVKEREVAATMALALLGNVLALQAMLDATARTGDVGYLWTLPWSFSFSCALMVGGAVARMGRMKIRFS